MTGFDSRCNAMEPRGIESNREIRRSSTAPGLSMSEGATNIRPSLLSDASSGGITECRGTTGFELLQTAFTHALNSDRLGC